MISLIYASSATQKMSSDELMTILNKAREKNQSLDITGMLLYRDGNFLQVLEGDEEKVTRLYNTIAEDARHDGILKLSQRPISQREFGDWKMGFVDLEQLKLEDVPGYSDYLNASLTADTFEDNPSLAMTFLQAFRDSIR